MLFDDAGRPRVIVKLARESSAEPKLAAEHAALRYLADRAPGLGGVPAPLMFEPVRGRAALASTVVPGVALSVGYYAPGHVSDADAVRTDFEAAGDWLSRLRAATSTASVELDATSFAALTARVRDRYRQLVGFEAWEQELFAALEREADEWSGIQVPLAMVHGDYAIANVLATDGVLTGVIDWECGRAGDLPFYDVFKLATSYSFYLDRAAGDDRGSVVGHEGWALARQGCAPETWPNHVGFRYGFFGDGWYPDLVRGFIAGQLADIGVPVEVGYLFLPVFLADQATLLDNPTFRDGYRGILQEVARQRRETPLLTSTP
jgi:aminoglycoside phosphotransferase